MEEMAASVQQNADNARQTDKIASTAAADAKVERRCRLIRAVRRHEASR